MDNVDMGMCKGIVFKLANEWKYKLSPHSMYDFDDLVSEAWETYVNCTRDFSTDFGVKFTTYFYSSVVRRFMTICRDEKTQKKTYTAADTDAIKESCVPDIFKSPLSPERLFMVNEAISAISEVSEDFALMIKDSVPKGLFITAKRNMRAIKFKRGVKTEGGTIRLTKHMVESYFNVKLKRISDLVYKYL